MSLSISNKRVFPPPYPSHRGRGIFKGINKIILTALKEDAFKEDITTKLLIPADQISQGYILIKEDAVLCGLDIALRVFEKVGPQIKFVSYFKDGTKVEKNTKVAFFEGKTRAILTAERTALNFFSYLSGIATNTSMYVKKIQPLKTAILDTRKTTPGLRALERYAVKCGGGMNHRFNLKEMVLVKDNHRKVFKNTLALINRLSQLKTKMRIPLEVEVDNLREFKQILNVKPDIILLDNFSVPRLKKAVKMLKINQRGGHKPLLEASGGITLQNIRGIAKTGVDRISIGALTHTHHAINVSLEIIN